MSLKLNCVQIMTARFTIYPFLQKVKFGSLCLCMGKCLNSGFLRNFGIQAGICSKLNRHMKIHIYMCARRQCHSLTFVRSHPDFSIKNKVITY